MNPAKLLARTNAEWPLLCTLFRQVKSKIFGFSKRRFVSEQRRKKNNVTIHHWINCNDLVKSIREPEYLILLCNYYLEHKFNLLGGGWICMNIHSEAGNCSYQKINWHLDFKSGYRFDDKLPSSVIAKMKLPEGVDIKCPWELSRMQHLPQLALASLIQPSSKQKYYAEFENEIRDFIKSNPVGMGVNWACTMDVALRVVSWLVAYDIFAQTNNIDAEFNRIFINSLSDHASFIISHLEKNFVEDKSGNHYLSNLIGLLFIGHYIKSERLLRWYRFAVREYQREIMKQYLPDGGIYEFSTAYQRLDCELTSLALAIMLGNDEEISVEIVRRVSRSLDIMESIVGPDGKIIQIGDNDSGHALALCPIRDVQSPYDFCKENALSAEPVLNMMRSLFACYSTMITLEGNLINGLSGGKKIEYFSNQADEMEGNVFVSENYHNQQYKSIKKTRLNMSIPLPIQQNYFPHFGLVVYKATGFALYLRLPVDLKCGKLTHVHNDFLHIEIATKDLRVFADQGSYLYTSDLAMRNLFRSVEAHNVPRHKVEQLETEGCWKVQSRASGFLISLSNKHVSAAMRIGDIFHIRSIYIDENGITVIDKSNQPFEAPFHEFKYLSEGYGYISTNLAALSKGYPEIYEVEK